MEAHVLLLALAKSFTAVLFTWISPWRAARNPCTPRDNAALLDLRLAVVVLWASVPLEALFWISASLRTPIVVSRQPIGGASWRSASRFRR